MLLLACVIGYIFGLLTGVVGLMAFGMSRLKKLDAKRKLFAQQIANGEKITGSVSERINQALDISEQQFDISARMEGPQNGPMHGKYKQIMYGQLKKLEEEKTAILKSIINDGYDPSLVVITETGEKETLKLSEFLNRKELLEQQKNPRARYTTPEPPKKKLSIVKNEEEPK